jgi:hypothetical protein
MYLLYCLFSCNKNGQKGEGEMGVALSVEKMSIEEKLQTMETIWDDYGSFKRKRNYND